MTSDQTTADTVTEAARVIRPLLTLVEGCAIDGGYQAPTGQATDLADTVAAKLADAGLLADPEGTS